MSSPRDAMSVATMTSYLPLLNPSSASIRSRCVRLECNTATACFACFKECATRSAFTFVRQKINTLSKFVRSRSRSEEHTSELQSHSDLVCRLLLEKKKKKNKKKNKDV